MSVYAEHVAKVIASDGPDEEDARLVEAMARGLWQAHEDRNPIRFTKQTWEQGSETARLHRLHDARAALSAYRSHMREEVEL